MPHVDEGTLHALLDGELAPAEAAEVRLHFATCPSCAARLDEARQLLAETERLVSALELPGGAARPARATGTVNPPPGAAAAATVADVLLPPSPGAPLPALDPVVLIPENPTVRELRRSRLRVMAWAAGFLVVVGAGYLGVTGLQQKPREREGRLRLSPDEFTTAPPRPEPGMTPDSAPTLALTDSDASALAKAKAPAQKPAPESESKTLAEQPRPAATRPAPAPSVLPPVAAVAAPVRSETARTANDKDAKPAPPKAPEAVTRGDAAPAEPSQEEAVNRGTAAQATLELDRRRTRERAAEATAELDRAQAQRRAAEERERQVAAERAAAAAPAPAAARPADDGTGLSSRIGLDEAARQLGGPLHAIDGMARQAVGLVPGASVDGADPARPVVRAVYVDRSSGTLLFLDQQMARPGDGPATPQTGRDGQQVWVKDGVLLVLHGGNVGADSLRSLARRVR